MTQGARVRRKRLRPHEVALTPEVHALVGVRDYGKAFLGDIDDRAFLDAIHAKINAVSGGDMAPVEAMLLGQAESLQAIFTHLSRRAFVNLSNYPEMADTFLRLALKAQSQCRANLEAIAEIKAPKAVAFVKQANIAHGPQQVNNGIAREETANPPNELLETQHGNRLDFGAQGAAGSCSPTLEAVGTIDRPKDD